MDSLADPFWNALTTEQAGLAVGSKLARRYPADVAPFAGLRENTAEAMAELRGLLAPGESIHLVPHGLAQCSGLELLGENRYLQMVYEGPAVSAADGMDEVEELTAADAPAMVALTERAFPGFFRSRTYVMGAYYGIRRNGRLIAMAGERLALPGLREISAVCTHPEHTGGGLASRLIRRVLQRHAWAGITTFLHVGQGNSRAIALYEHFGFVKRGLAAVSHVRRIDVQCP